MSPARQARSQETLGRILDAAERLFDGRSFSEIPVLEICEAADVSPSSFYYRFDNKEALLVHLHRRRRARERAAMDMFAAEIASSDLPIEEVMRLAARAYLTYHLDDQQRLQTLRIAELAVPHLADERRATAKYGVDVVVAAVEDLLEAEDPLIRRRIQFATRALTAAMVEAVERPGAFADDLGLTVDEVANESARMWLRYVFDD